MDETKGPHCCGPFLCMRDGALEPHRGFGGMRKFTDRVRCYRHKGAVVWHAMRENFKNNRIDPDRRNTMGNIDRRTILASGAAALAGAASGSGAAQAQSTPKTILPSPRRRCRLSAKRQCFRCDGSIVSDATMPPTRLSAAPIPIASRHSSFRSRRMRSRTLRSAPLQISRSSVSVADQELSSRG